MITALVQFTLPKQLSIEQAKGKFTSTVPKYRDVPGLLRKYYILAKDGKTAGGVYLWRSQEDADKLYTEEWKKFILDKYGAEPTIVYFACPVVVDNMSDQILAEE